MVTGGNRLSGEVAVGGAKNSVLKLMAASLLAEGTSTITNCPDILDVPLMAEVLRGLGATVELDGDVVRITSPDEPKYDADFAAVRQFRASVCVLGPLVGRCKRAKVALPGGDAIGSRPLDMHQAGLRQLGARCNIEHGCVVAEADHLRGAEIQLEFPSVGATENILMAAVVAEGVTTIHNAAREPDVVDLCTMLNQMGAQISGAGTSTMTITGVDRALSHRAPGDRRPHRRRHLGYRGRDDARGHLGDGGRPAAPPGGAAQAARCRCHRHADRRRLPGGPVRAAQGGQRRDPAVPGFPDRSAADGHRRWRRSPTARR